MPPFEIVSEFKPTGDQPRAIEELVEGLAQGHKHQTLLGATGTGKSLGHNDPVFVVEETDGKRIARVTSIGDLIDHWMERAEARLEGDSEIVDLNNDSVRLYAQSFDPQTCAVNLHPIQSLVRHAAPATMYRLTTACGRAATLTGDHNLWVLRKGQLTLIETADARQDDCIPVPERLMADGNLQEIDTIAALMGKKLFVDASETMQAYVEQHGIAVNVDAMRASEIASPYSNLSAMRRKIRNQGIGLESFQPFLSNTDDFDGLWDTNSAAVSAKRSRVPVQPRLTQATLRLMGYYIAEGNHQDRYVVIANREPCIRTDIETALHELGIAFTVRPSSDYQIDSKPMADLLAQWCGETARTKHLPAFWADLSEADLGQLLRAYFDGDATVGHASDVVATTASTILANDLMYALLNLGIWARVKRKWKRATNSDHQGDWYYDITVSGQANLRLFQEKIGFSLERKQIALERELGRPENSNVDVVPIDGTMLRQLRHKLGMTTKQLGEQSGLSHAIIQLYETGQRAPGRSSLKRVLLALRLRAENRSIDSETWWTDFAHLEHLTSLRWTRVATIEPIEYTHPYVYDFCVPGVENFLAGVGGFFVHNTFSIAHVIQAVQRPALILAHNKTLAAQLYAEFKEFFPRNAVEYYVSYYDYYQPESYVPRYDLFIEKQTDINEQIERLRIAAKAALFSRKDVIIVASVSCIYATGDPQTWSQSILELRQGAEIQREAALRRLVALQYTRAEMDFAPGSFRARGDVLEIYPPYENAAYRITLFGDEIEKIMQFDPTSGELLAVQETIVIFPAAQFVADNDKLQQAIRDIERDLEERIAFFKREGKLLEAQRIEQRVRYDLEMLREMGFTPGIENYSRSLDQRAPGSPPFTMIDYFPKDYLMIIDESHMTIPQVRGMYNGDRARKETLVEYGFRLPSAMDNRPLRFEEFEERMGQTIYTTATPGPYERGISQRVVQQIIRPTGVLDPEISVRPTKGQIDDLLQEIAARVKKGQRVIVTTLTQRMSEELAGYINEVGVRAHYLHAEINTLERVEILRDLRLGIYDVIVGINLLREGIDLPEVSLVVILDADKEGFLRSESALIQIVGRAARHVEGTVIMYADRMTDSMRAAIDETNRRRAVQHAHNEATGIQPTSIIKQVRDLTDRVKASVTDDQKAAGAKPSLATIPKDELYRMIKVLEEEMKRAAKGLEFEKAAMLRDQMVELRQILADREPADDLLLR
ncbi:MAG: excinuclease ABC subunit UvrB [Chloroflexota bacterium]|mgnify:CR=1 FL=1|nr:excinuclease ABC subunit UvrB [Chloroflexota bacterium]